MNDKRLAEMMRALYETNVLFRKALDLWRRDGGKQPEPERLKIARNDFWNAFNLLFRTRLDPLNTEFATDRANSIDSVIDFLEIDIPAFRCGYEKEKYLRKLKAVSLSNGQKTRLKNAALALAREGNFRREFVEWTRLMIVLADSAFLRELQLICPGIRSGDRR